MMILKTYGYCCIGLKRKYVHRMTSLISFCHFNTDTNRVIVCLVFKMFFQFFFILLFFFLSLNSNFYYPMDGYTLRQNKHWNSLWGPIISDKKIRIKWGFCLILANYQKKGCCWWWRYFNRLIGRGSGYWRYFYIV